MTLDPKLFGDNPVRDARFDSKDRWHDLVNLPPDHPDSNYGMAYETLISKITIPAKNVRRIIGEGNPEESARLYENQLPGEC